MFNFLNLIATGGRFFDEADSGSGGGDQTGGEMKTAGDTHKEPTERLRTKPTSAKEFLSKSKLVKTEGQTADGRTVTVRPEEGQETAPKADEGAKKYESEKKVLVSGLSAKQQPKSEPGQGSAEGPEGEGTTTTDKVKIGEVEYTVEQIEAGQKALQSRKKDEESCKTWQANLTKKSQIASNLTDQQIQEILPFTTAQRKLPDDIKAEMAKLEDVPKSFTVTDDEGFETTVNLEDIPEEVLDKLANSAMMKKWPEYQDIVAERDRLKADNEKISSSVSQEQYDRGVDATIELMKKHEDLAITLMEGDDLGDTLAKIFNAGKLHPEYENAVRLTIAMKAVNDGIVPDLDTAYSTMISGNKQKTEAAAQVLKNQGETPSTEKPTGQRNPMDEGRAFLEKKRSVKGQKIAKLGR